LSYATDPISSTATTTRAHASRFITVTEADRGTAGGRDGWRVTFHVEADVPARRLRNFVAGYDEAVDYVVEIARGFNEGVHDPAEFYAEGDVRDEYVARLREETGN